MAPSAATSAHTGQPSAGSAATLSRTARRMRPTPIGTEKKMTHPNHEMR
jgi:hypothetical protein